MREHPPLAPFSAALSGACTLARPSTAQVTLDAPALDGRAEFAQVAPATIERSARPVAANDSMVTRGVRSPFVVAPDGRLVGLVTTTDVLGEAPAHASHTRGVKRHELARRLAEFEHVLAESGDGRTDPEGRTVGFATLWPNVRIVRPPALCIGHGSRSRWVAQASSLRASRFQPGKGGRQ